MANGFVTTSPAARHGSSDQQTGAGWLWAQKFACPSGTQEISEIGLWCLDSGFEFRLAIFTDDSGNACPDVMVSNSESATLTSELSMAKESHTYGTKPELTGGVDYWLVAFFDDLINVDYESSSGIDGLTVTGYTAYTWATGDDWHTHTDRPTFDIGIYAVYAAAGGGANAPTGTIYGPLFGPLGGPI